MSATIAYEPHSGKKVRVLDVTYRQDEDGSWPARIYMPERRGPYPAILDVHGGAWMFGGHTDNELIDLALAAAGLVVLAIECRHAPTYSYPSQVVDVNYATRWLKAHAGDCNALPTRVGGLGTSSGGHSLLLSAMRPDDARYAALPLSDDKATDARLAYLIAAWPVLDPYGRYWFARENGRDFLIEATDTYFLSHAAMQEGNPLLALERGEKLDLPPILIVQGTADNNVPLDSVHRWVKAYRAAGGVVEVEWFPDMPHGFATKPGVQTDHAMDRIKDFAFHQLGQSTGA